MLLIQYLSSQGALQVGLWEEAAQAVRRVTGVPGTYALAQQAIQQQKSLAEMVQQIPLAEAIPWNVLAIENRLLPPLLSPDPAHLILSGTGLTHLGSATSRDHMHQQTSQPLTDSMRMFQAGIKGGKPSPGTLGAQPEWFYKGTGHNLVAPGQPLLFPAFGEDLGEEPEIVAIYLIGADQHVYRLGFALGNEASDHVVEQQNYLLLAHSKLRNCSVGPALYVGEFPTEIQGVSRIRRQKKVIWEESFLSGAANMSHSLSNLESHHFKYPDFRIAGDVHFHFLGTSCLSFSQGIRLQHGDEVEISAPGWGPPLKNPIQSTSFSLPNIHRL